MIIKELIGRGDTMTEEKKKDRILLGDKKYTIISEEEFQQIKESIEKERQGKEQNTQSLPVKSDLDKAKEADARRTESHYQEQVRLENESKEIEARHVRAEAEGQKAIAAWQQLFYGETEEHVVWRNKLYELTQQKLNAYGKKAEELEKARIELLNKYIKKHYEFGIIALNKVLMYQSKDGALRIFSEDDGHTWKVQELQQGQWVHGNKKVVLENGKPTRISQPNENAAIYDFCRTGVYADYLLNLKEEPDKPIVPKITVPKPKPLVFEHEHKYLNHKCCICGKDQPKEQYQ